MPSNFWLWQNPYQVLHLITKCSKIVNTIQKLLPLQEGKRQKINRTSTSWENYWRYALDYNIGITPLLFTEKSVEFSYLFINVSVQTSLYAPRLISRTLKLTTM